jgi:hypothetical protein
MLLGISKKLSVEKLNHSSIQNISRLVWKCSVLSSSQELALAVILSQFGPLRNLKHYFNNNNNTEIVTAG